MKKTSLFLALFASAVLGKTYAGSFKVINMTPCDFELYSGIGSQLDPSGASYQFTFGPINVTANGQVTYNDLSTMPNFSTYAPNGVQQGSVLCAELTKVNGPGPGYAAFPIGKMTPYTSYTSTNNPTCNGGNNYNMFWNIGSNNCDAVILIF